MVFFTSIFFGTMRLFLKFFGLHQKVSPSFVSVFCNTIMSKIQRVPLYFFRHCDTVQKSHFQNFFGNFQKSPKDPLFNFLIFRNQLEFRKAQRVPPSTILSLKYSADFGRSRLVMRYSSTVSYTDIFLVGVFEENPDSYRG